MHTHLGRDVFCAGPHSCSNSSGARRRIGGASTGQALAGLSDETRRAVREEVWRDFGHTSGPLEVEAEYRIANDRR